MAGTNRSGKNDVQAVALSPAMLRLASWPDLALNGSTTITATKRDDLVDDADSSGSATPGDTLEYTIMITNSGGADALGARFTDTLDTNTTLLGDVLVSPIALDDQHDVLGNTSISITAPAGVLTNDLDPDSGTITVLPVNGGATSEGGDITMSADGAFTYDPPAGFSGTDVFTYTIEDEDGLQGTGVIDFSVSNLIWYVDDGAAIGGDGRLSAPFDTVGEAEAAAEAGNIVFLYEGNYGSGLTLTNSVQLIGQGVDLASGAGLTPPMGTTLPTQTISPTLSGPVMVAQDNTMRGLTVANGTATGLTGTNFGSLSVSNVAISGAGRALSLDNGSLNATFDVIVSTNSGGDGVRLSAVSGSLLINSGQIEGATSVGFYVDGGTADITYNGTIVAEDAGSYAVRIFNKSSGTVLLESAISSVGGAGRGIGLANNSGAVVNFGGVINLSTASNVAFNASGGGTVNATAPGSTISTSSATAVVIDGVTIGGDGVTFQSISANGGAKGIVLRNAAGGGFTVTGVGSSDGSGGTIQNISVRAIEVINTDNVSFANMALTNANTADAGGAGVCDALNTANCNAAIYLNGVAGASFNNVDVSGVIAEQGINGIAVDGFSLLNSTLSNCGDAVAEGCLKMRELSATSVISGSELSFAAEKNVEISNSSGSLTLSVVNSTFRDTQTSAVGADGLEIVTEGAAQTSVEISGTTFLRNRTNGLQVSILGSSTLDLDVTGSTFDADGGLGKGIELIASDSAQLTFDVLSNPVIHSNGGNAVTVAAFDSSVIQGRVNNNGDIQVGGSSTPGNGIFVHANDNAGGSLEIINNTISNIGFDDGIYITARPDLLVNPTGRLDVTLAENNITIDATSLYGIELLAQPANTLCASVYDNSVTGSGLAAFRVREVTGGTALLQNFITDAATTWSARGNTGAPVSESPAGAASNGTCATPSHALAPLEDGVYALRRASSVEIPRALVAAEEPGLAQEPAQEFSHSQPYFVTAAKPANAPALQSTADVEVGPFTLPAGKSVTIKFQVTIADPYPAGAPAQVQNQGRVSGSNFTAVLTDDPDTAQGGDPTITPLDLRADLSVSKDDGQTSAIPGEPLTYTIVVSNSGPHAVAGAIVSDTLPTALTGATWTCAAGSGADCGVSSGSGDINETVDLNVGSVLTFTISATIAPDATGTLVNTAGATAPAGVTDPVAGNNSATDNTALTPQVDLVLAQTESVDPVLAGSGTGNLTYVITLTNQGPSLASNVTVSETLVYPGDVTLDGVAYNAANASFSAGVWTVNQLAVGVSEMLTVTLTAGSGAAAGDDVIGSTVAVTGADQSIVNTGDDSATDLTSIVRSADVALSVNESIDPVSAGSGVGNLIYVVTVENLGPSNASGVVVSNTLTLPAGVSVESVTPSGSTTWNGVTESWAVGDLPASNSETLTVVFTVGAAAGAGTDVIGDQATIVAMNESDSDGSNDSAAENTSISSRADLVVDIIDVPDPVVAGETLTYTVSVANNGPSDAHNVVVTDTLDSGVTLLDTSGCAEDPAGSPTCTLGTITAGTGVSYTIVAKVDAAATGTLQSSVNVSSDNDEASPGDESDAESTTVNTAADMTVHKEGEPDPAVAGTALTYTIAITNYGPSVATTVLVTDTLPNGFSYGGDNCGGSLSGDDWSWAAGTVTVNANYTCLITGTVDAGFSGALANTAVVSSAVSDPQPSNNSFTDQTTIHDNRFSIGDVIGVEGDGGATTFTFTITRTTNAAASSVDVATGGGTASAGADYTSLPVTTINFAAGGSFTQTVAVEVNGDAVVELDETFYVNLSNPTNGAIDDGQGVGTIVNDDSAAVTIDDVAQEEGDSGTTNFVFTVTLSAEVDTGVSVNYVTVDGTAQNETRDGDYNSANGVLIFSGAAGEIETITIAVEGDVKVEKDEIFLITLDNLDAGGRDVTLADDEAEGFIRNDDVAVVDFSSAHVAQSESGGAATISVTLSLQAAFTVTVDYASSDGTATSGADYTAIAGTLTFTPGETGHSLTLPILGDTLDEDDETAVLTLSNPSGATLGTVNNPATVTIVDDDGEPTVGFSAFDFQVNESSPAAVISVTLSHVSGREVSVDYASRDETATEGGDYSAVSGRLTIPAGQRVMTFTVPILDDLLDEVDESVELALSNATNAAIGAVNPATLTIVDDDASPTVSFGEADYQVGEADSALITVTLDAASALEVRVDYASSDGTASAGDDYTAVVGTLTFSPGQTTASFTVSITADDRDERDETVQLALDNPANATLGAPHVATLTIVDDDYVYYFPISLKGVDFPPTAAFRQRLR